MSRFCCRDSGCSFLYTESLLFGFDGLRHSIQVVIFLLPLEGLGQVYSYKFVRFLEVTAGDVGWRRGDLSYVVRVPRRQQFASEV